jgi:hypothetical protein
VQAVERGLGDAGLQPRGGLAALELDAPLPQRDQVAPAVLTLEQALEAGLEALVARTQREQLLHVIHGAVGLAREVAGDVRGLLEQLDAAGLADRRDQRLVIEGEQLLPALGERVDRGQLGEGPVGAGLHGEDAEEDAGEAGVVVAEPGLVEGRGAATELLGDLGREVVREGLAVGGGDLVDALEHLGELLGELPVLVLIGFAARGCEGGCEGLVICRVGCHRGALGSFLWASSRGRGEGGRATHEKIEARTIPGICVSAGAGPVSAALTGECDRARAGRSATCDRGR